MTFEQLHDLYFSQPGAKLDGQALRYFWDSAIAAEREACAKVAELRSCRDWAGGSTGNAVGTSKNIAAAIRARKP